MPVYTVTTNAGRGAASLPCKDTILFTWTSWHPNIFLNDFTLEEILPAVGASLMTDAANYIKLRNDPVMRIIKFICIFLLNLNTQIKPCSQGDAERCSHMVTGHLPQSKFHIINFLQLINNKWDVFSCLMDFREMANSQKGNTCWGIIYKVINGFP